MQGTATNPRPRTLKQVLLRAAQAGAAIVLFTEFVTRVVGWLHFRAGCPRFTAVIDASAALLQAPTIEVLKHTPYYHRHAETGGMVLLVMGGTFALYSVAALVVLLARRAWGGRNLRLGRMLPAPAEQTMTWRPSRRAFLGGAMGKAAFVGAASVGGYALAVEPQRLRIDRRTVRLPGLPASLDGLTAVQITDVHHGPWLSADYVRQVVRAANALKPDLVFLTGDYLFQTGEYARPVAEMLAELRGRIGVVGVLGNHDWWENADHVRKEFSRVGLPLIDNSRVFVRPDRTLGQDVNGAGLCVAGIGDYWGDEQHYDDALGGLPDSLPRLLLSHNPDVAEDGAFLKCGHRVDLMISGHTHGGQVRLPILGRPIVPSNFGEKYAYGFARGPKCLVYTCAGVGMSMLPVRFRVPPEIALLEFKSAPPPVG